MLYRLLRPELVKSFETPLCPDSFTGYLIFSFCVTYNLHICYTNRFYLENKVQHNQEVRLATQHLMERVLPNFAMRLEELLPPKKMAIRHFDTLKTEMHRRGINIR